MPPKRTVSFHPTTKPPAEPKHKHIQIVGDTEILLRNCQVWIPVQVFDMISLRLSKTSCNVTDQPTLPGDPSYQHKPPYADILHDLSFITSFPLTPEVVAEVQEMCDGRPPLPRNATKFQHKQWEAWQDFDEMNASFIALQRQRVDASKKLRDLAQAEMTRLPGAIPSPRQRAAAGQRALEEAQSRARYLSAEAVEMWRQGQRMLLSAGVNADADDGQEMMEDDDTQSSCDSQPPPRKKPRFH